VEPEPFRTIGLVWRSTTPRTDDFEELGRLVIKAWTESALASARAGGGRPRKTARAFSNEADAGSS
jgi:LysR family hydrogen peroxide-inducible transcriptional activator